MEFLKHRLSLDIAVLELHDQRIVDFVDLDVQGTAFFLERFHFFTVQHFCLKLSELQLDLSLELLVSKTSLGNLLVHYCLHEGLLALELLTNELVLERLVLLYEIVYFLKSNIT